MENKTVRIQKLRKHIYLNGYMNMEMYSQRLSQKGYHYRSYMTMQLSLRKIQYFPNQQRKGYIQPSTSPIAAPFFFVKKHDRSLHPVIDYRALNGITIKNHYPIP